MTTYLSELGGAPRDAMLILPGGYPGYVNLSNSDKVIDLLHKTNKAKNKK